VQTSKTPVAIPPGVTVVAGAKGKDCEAACGGEGLVCNASALAAVNQCDLLRDYFECEAGCDKVTGKPEAPAYVVYGVSKTLCPTMCFAAKEEEEPLSCGSVQPHMQRLCACSHATEKDTERKLVGDG
jgi:hypothetical protein